MKTGNAIVATFFLAMAHIIVIICFLATPLLIHYGVDPSILPIDPGSIAIPLWFVYMFIGILFLIGGMGSKEKTDIIVKKPVISKKDEPKVEPRKTPPAITQDVIEPLDAKLSMLTKNIAMVVIKPNVMKKKDVSDIQKHVDDLLLSRSNKITFDAKKDDLSILMNEHIPDVIIPPIIRAVDDPSKVKKEPDFLYAEPHAVLNSNDQPPAKQVTSNIDNIVEARAEIDQMRNDIAERKRKQEQLAKEVETIESQ